MKMIQSRANIFIIILLLFHGYESMAQGRMLIVGGGSEKNGANSWSTPPYRWAVENRRVAIVGIETGTLASYMKNQCGALYAKEFAIATRDSADSQASYDTLMSYDVIFFRGGDQWEYYNLYKGTRLEAAVTDKFNQGGCIGGTSAGMHILSSVVYTAENGTVYPYECIENPENPYVTLENDFLDLRPGFVFDTHFSERGRFGRLLGFMANYRFNHDQDIIGLGMDDMTCMTIDENGLGMVWGTGCANLYLPEGGFSRNGNKLLADSIAVVQLLKGCTYDFITGEAGFHTLDRLINTSGQSETGNYTILASGSNLLNDNLTMLADLVASCGVPQADILILTGDNTLAGNFRTRLLSEGAGAVSVYNPVAANGSDAGLASVITSVTKVLFIKNNETTFMQFLQTPNGALLARKLKSDGMITAFAGQDARLAGTTVIGNYLTYLASWYGELTYTPGLGLLRNTVLMPETYLNSDIYENTATAVPYAMALDTLKFGIWLTNHNYMKAAPSNGKFWLTGYGSAPVMIVANHGEKAGFSQQTATGGSGAPRMVAGFEKLSIDLIDHTTPYLMGEVSPAGIPGLSAYEQVSIIPNPATEHISFDAPDKAANWKIYTPEGRVAMEGVVDSEKVGIQTGMLPPGTYLLMLSDVHQKVVSIGKFIKTD